MKCKECVNNKVCKGAVNANKKSVELIIKIAKRNNKECPIHKWR